MLDAMTCRPILACVAVTIALAISEQAHAESDQEKFYPISIGCPANPADELVLVSANAAGRYTRMMMKANRVTLSVRNRETDWKFRKSYDVAEGEVDGLPGEAIRTLVRGSFRVLRDLKRDICDGTSDYFGRYQRMLEENRRITGARWSIPE